MLNSFYLLYKLNWKLILKIDSIIFDSSNEQQKTNRLNNHIKSIFLSKPDINPTPFETNILFLKSMNRNDYDKQFNQIQQFSKNSILLNLKYKTLTTKRLYPLYIIFKYLPLLLLTNIRFVSYKKIFYLITCQIKYLEVSEKIYKNTFKYLVVHADMQPIENTLCQIAKQKNIKTVTLQHGLYVDYKNNFNINIVNYENQIADYFLAWGEDTKKLIKRYHTNTKVIICGKPLNSINASKTGNYFSLVFDQNIFHEYNVKILEIAYSIAKEYNLKINLRLHPNNKIGWYKIDSKYIIFDAEIYHSKFIIGHTTSMLFELMRLGLPSYKLKSDIPTNSIDNDFLFSTIKELSLKIANHKKNNFDFSKYAEQYIRYIDQKSLTKYAIFFKRLENGKI